jgi:succinoglycan biosynthesis transport protein ExoP
MQDNLPTEMPLPAAAPMSPAPVMSYTDEFERGVHLRDYWHILKKRKWWFWGVLSGVVVVVLLVTFLMSPIYNVTATLQIIQDNPSALMGGEKTDPLGVLAGSSELDRFYETQYKILQSPTIAYGLIDSLKLQDHPSYKRMERKNPDDPPEVIRQKYAQYLLDNLKVEPVKNSYLVDISYKSTDKELAQKIPEVMQKEYLKLSMATRQQSYAMLREWLDNELERLGNKLELSEKSVYADGQKKDFLSLETPETNVTIQKYIEVSRLLTTAQADKAGKEAQYRQIKEKGADAPLITNHALIQQLRQQLIGLEAQVSGDNKIFGHNFPDNKAQTTKLRDLRQRLNQEIKRLEASIRADYEAASRAESLLQKEFDLQKAKVIDLQNSLVQHHILKRDLQTNQTLYEGLLARMKEASVASTMVASNVSVITRAEPPYKPWLPKPLLFLALALAIGSMGGVMTAFFVEYLDSSIKTTDELEKVCHIPALGIVPMFSGNSKPLATDEHGSVGLIPYSQPMSMLSEAIFHIRSSIMLSVSETPPQVIMVTSANPGEGKSSISSNLAIVMATPDRKCLLLDCDLRKPTIHRIFSRPLQPGLTNYLTGNATLEEIIQPTVVPNLYLIPAGPTPPNPNELFNSFAFKNLIHHLRQKFHHIIIDSPPLIGFADGRFIAANVDGTLFAVKHHSTTREAGRLAVQLLSQNHSRILGGILTMGRKERLGYGGYYGYYQYYHKYYKGYHGHDDGKSPSKTDPLN